MRSKVISICLLAVADVAFPLAAEAGYADRGRDQVLLQSSLSKSASARKLGETESDHSDQEYAFASDEWTSVSEQRVLHSFESLFWCPPRWHQPRAHTVPLSGGSFVPVLASFPPGSIEVTSAIVVIHGASREGEGYFGGMVDKVLQQKKEKHTLVVAPVAADKPCSAANWSSGADGVPDDAQAARWTSLRRWMYGGSSDSTEQHFEISSFDVLDSVVAWIQLKYPNLQRLVITGHSAGAQHVLRWAVMSPEGANGVTRYRGHHLPLTIIVSSPSSVIYLSEERPASTCRPDQDQGPQWSCNNFSIPGPESNCGSKWDTYGAGIGGLYEGASSEGKIRYQANAYLMRSISPYDRSAAGVRNEVRSRWATKDVRFMFGEWDIWHCDIGACANDCEFMLQGTSRLQRGLNYMSYLKQEFPDSQPLWGVFHHGHNYRGAYSSHLFTTWALPYDSKGYSVMDREIADVGGDKGIFVDVFYAAWECMEKCDSTPGCNSFSYNPIWGNCYLKDKCVSSTSLLVSPKEDCWEVCRSSTDCREDCMLQTYWKDCAR